MIGNLVDCTHRERPEEPVDLPEVLLAPLPLLLGLQDEDAHRVDAARDDLVQHLQVWNAVNGSCSASLILYVFWIIETC